jgi:GLPGLI family protein
MAAAFCFSQDKYTQKITYDLKVKISENNYIDEEMMLLIGQKESVYCNATKIILDSISNYHMENKDMYGLQSDAMYLEKKGKNMIKYAIWKNNSTYMYQVNGGMKTIQYAENLPKFNWQIDSKSAEEILGYKVQKAETTYEGKKYYAWFSTEIPLNNGPFVFNGLPGLILKVQNESNTYSITIKSLQNENKPFPQPEKGKRVIETKKENFYKTLEGTMKEIQGKIMDAEGVKTIKEGTKKLLAAKFLFGVV